MKKNINIEIVGSENTIVYSDSVSLSIMIRNLVDNAIRYTKPGGEVIIDIASSNQDEIVLSVSDTGPGIEPELQARVFDRFYRATGHSSTGCGLGLSIVKRAADLNNLKVELVNKEQGSGLIASVHFNTLVYK
jgi:two-component system sensor histidine kinase QseC